MVVVIGRVVLAGWMLMARRTNLIARVNQLRRMHIVAVTTLDAVVKHFRLNERSMYIVFVSDLPVGKVSGFVNSLQNEVLIKVAARRKAFYNFRSPRVARGTSVDLSQIAFGFQFRQTVTMVAIPKQTRSLGKLNVITGRPVTSLATDIDLRKSRMVAVGGEIKVFLKVGAMANRAGRVPILSGPGPMQWVRWIKLFRHVWWRQVKPLLLLRVPRHS